jgi:hypothetical protein
LDEKASDAESYRRNKPTQQSVLKQAQLSPGTNHNHMLIAMKMLELKRLEG